MLIYRLTHEYLRSNAPYSRTQFSLTIAYAITVYKAQGITVDQAVLNVAQPDFALGLSYVAMSRVRTLDGLMFDEPFNYERFRLRRKEPANAEMRNADAVRREHSSCVRHLSWRRGRLRPASLDWTVHR